VRGSARVGFGAVVETGGGASGRERESDEVKRWRDS
jgi:hypothetical protein